MEILNFDVLDLICQKMDFGTLFSFSVTNKAMKSISKLSIEKNFPLYTLHDGTTIPRKDYYKFVHSDDAERKLAFSISASGPVGLVKCNMSPPFRFLLLLARSYLETNESVALHCGENELEMLIDEAETVFGKVRLTKDRIWTTREICNRSKKNKTPTTPLGKIYLCEQNRSYNSRTYGESYHVNGVKIMEIGYVGSGLVSVKQYEVAKESERVTVNFESPSQIFLESIEEIPSNVNIFASGAFCASWVDLIVARGFKKATTKEFKRGVEKGKTGLMTVVTQTTGRGSIYKFNCETLPPIFVINHIWDLPTRLLFSLRNKTVFILMLHRQ